MLVGCWPRSELRSILLYLGCEAGIIWRNHASIFSSISARRVRASKPVRRASRRRARSARDPPPLWSFPRAKTPRLAELTSINDRLAYRQHPVTVGQTAKATVTPVSRPTMKSLLAAVLEEDRDRARQAQAARQSRRLRSGASGATVRLPHDAGAFGPCNSADREGADA
jgi:hypothetical protein